MEASREDAAEALVDPDLYQMVVENASDVLWTLDLDTGEIAYVSPACERILGITPAEQRERLGSLGMLTADSAAEAGRHLERLLRGEVDECSYEAEHVTKERGSVWCEVRMRTRRDTHGRARHVVGITRDISERKRLEQALHESESRSHLQRRLEAVGRISGGVAHDFNNILTIVMGNLEIAQTAPPAELPSLLANALDACERAATITRRLLAFAGQQPLSPRRLCLSDTLASLEPVLQSAIGPSISLVFDCDPEAWSCAADPAETESVVLNLVLNARDAMPRGGTIRIGVRNMSMPQPDGELPTGEYTLLSVEDEGEGIEPELIERVVEPFFTTKQRGSGLGLSMATGFARQSGGALRIRSRPGHGTVVELALPRATQAAQDADPKIGAASGRPGSGQRVLVVDDDPQVRQLVLAMLAQLGYRGIPAANAQEAFERLARPHGIDAILSDIMLDGEVDGVELVRRSTQERPDLAAAYMSGFIEPAGQADGRMDASLPLLRKPFSSRDLSRLVTRMLGESAPGSRDDG